MSVRRSLVWAFSGQAVAFVTAFIGSVILARLLSPSETGVYAVATAVSGVISIVASFGVASYVIREVDLTDDVLATAFTVNTGVNVLLAALVFFSSGPVAAFMHNRGVADVMRVISVTPLLGVFEFRPSAMLQRNMDFRSASAAGIGSGTVGVVSTVLLALAGYSYMSMAYSAILQSLTSVLLNNFFGRRHIGFRTRLRGSRNILVFGFRMMSISGVAMLAGRATDLIMGRTLGVASLGIYSRASGLSNLVYFNIYGTATRVVFAQLSKEFRETGQLGEAFIRGLEMILAVMWPLLLGIAVLSPAAIRLLYGHKWDAAAAPLSLLMIGQILTLSYGMNWELYVLTDQTAKQTKYEIIRSIIGAILFAIGCGFSIIAATCGRVLDSALGSVFYFPKMSKLAGVPRSRMSRTYVRSGLLAISAVLPSALVMIWSRWSPATPLYLIVPAVALGGAGWLAALWRMRHPLFAELLMGAGRLGLSLPRRL